MVDFGFFCDCFMALLEAKGKKDPSGFLTKMYYQALVATAPSDEELWSAIAAFIDAGGPFPPSGEIKQLIWDERKRNAPALPAAQEVKKSPAEARQNRVSLLIGIYKHQGDTQFYRNMLASNAGMWSRLVGNLTGSPCPVDHEEVMAAIALQESGRAA